MAPTLFSKGNLIPRMGEKKEDLDKLVPIDYIMNWISNRLPRVSSEKIIKPITMSDRVIVLLSKTGSGKSTAFPTNIFLRFNRRYRKKILITQPRVLTAIDIPKSIVKEPSYTTKSPYEDKIEYGENIGYQTKEFVKRPLKKGILFATVGILLQFLKVMTDEEFIKQFKFIIIDEVHERSLDIDLVMLLMKDLIQRNIKNDPPFLVVTSATIDAEKYASYFGTKTIFEVSGMTNPIDMHFLDYDTSNYIDSAIHTIKKIHTEFKSDYYNEETKEIDYKNKGEIIIFAATTGMCVSIYNQIHILNETLEDKIFPIILTGDSIKNVRIEYYYIGAPLERLIVTINDKNYKPTRKVYIATNVAETGLTLDNLKYCVDIGLINAVEYNARYNSNMVFIKPATQSMVLQRRGRVGRKQKGLFYPLYSEDTFNALIVEKPPTIHTSDITEHILNIQISNLNANLEHLDLMSRPSDDSIKMSLTKLYVLGALDSNKEPTEIGILMNKFQRLSIESRRMILSSIYYEVDMMDMIIIACFLEMGQTAITERGFKGYDSSFQVKEGQSDIDYFNFNKLKTRLLISCEMIEFVLFYKQFIKFVETHMNNTNDILQWCVDKKVNYASLIQLTEMIDDVVNAVLFSININMYQLGTTSVYEDLAMSEYMGDEQFIKKIVQMKKCIYEGYKMNVLIRKDDYTFQSLMTHQDVIVPSKMIRNLSSQKIGEPIVQTKPKFILYTSLSFQYSKDDKKYQFFTTGPITILDGFIDIDFTFLES